jgi:hypothetical protein
MYFLCGEENIKKLIKIKKLKNNYTKKPKK